MCVFFLLFFYRLVNKVDHIHLFIHQKMVASKKKYKKKIKKYTIIKSESTKKPICIVGYFHNILLSIMFIFIC